MCGRRLFNENPAKGVGEDYLAFPLHYDKASSIGTGGNLKLLFSSTEQDPISESCLST